MKIDRPSVGPAIRGRFTGRMNINTATVNQLIQLPGIGEAVAERIVLYPLNLRGDRMVAPILLTNPLQFDDKCAGSYTE